MYNFLLFFIYDLKIQGFYKIMQTVGDADDISKILFQKKIMGSEN